MKELFWIVFQDSFSDKTEPLTIPRSIDDADFKQLANLLLEEEDLSLHDYYMCDKNDTLGRFVLKDEIMHDDESRKSLQEICLHLLLGCFEGKYDLWKYFAPGKSLSCVEYFRLKFKAVNIATGATRISKLTTCDFF